MNIALFQADTQWQAPEENRRHIQKQIETLQGVDLVVLPEMFTTGFCISPRGVAETANTTTLEWMQQMAAQKSLAMAGSIAVREQGKYYNRFYFVRPDGNYSTYDKHHLFSFGGEDKEYTPGQERVVVEWGGFQILLQICYDLRFPVFSRNRNDYDMILYVAAWPTARLEAWNTLLRARAIENQCYVVGVNRTGVDPHLSYSGGTQLIDFLGQLLVSAPKGEEALVCGRAEQTPLREFRAKFPAWSDADPFILER